jgi:hypothetical protein
MTTDAAADTHPAAVPTLRVRGPADLVQAVPYLLGFHPSRSLVLLGLDHGRVVVTARMDLADLAEPMLLPGTVSAMNRGGADKFVGVIFDDAALGDGRPGETRPLPWTGAAAEVSAAVERVGAVVDDVLLVSGSRMWSYTCDEPSCCPPEGEQLQPSTEVAAVATYAGLVALPDRAAVAALLDPAPASQRAALLPRLDQAERDSVATIVRGDSVRADRSIKRALFAAARSADSPGTQFDLSDDEVVRFGVALQRIQLRDAAWMAIDDRRIDGRPLWRLLARRLPEPYDAPALFLFGWRTWRDGDGALAGMAAERALASDPGYSAADLLLAALSQAIDPRHMPRLRRARG